MISAQLSLYPLRQEHLSPAIQAVREVLLEVGLQPHVGPMSTVVTDEVATVFAGLQEAFVRAAAGGGASAFPGDPGHLGRCPWPSDAGASRRSRGLRDHTGVSGGARPGAGRSGAGGAPGATPAAEPRVPTGWTFRFPEGDARAGQTVFITVQCYSCNAINIPDETLPSDAVGIGPDLTPGYSKLPAEYLAESIIKAHTVVAAPGHVVQEGKAIMGNYNHFLTVQELIALVAFLKHLPAARAR